MPAERLSMRKVREVLRLKYACGVSARVISRSLGRLDALDWTCSRGWLFNLLLTFLADPKPFIWTKSAGEILKKVARAKQALESQH